MAEELIEKLYEKDYACKRDATKNLFIDMCRQKLSWNG